MYITKAELKRIAEEAKELEGVSRDAQFVGSMMLILCGVLVDLTDAIDRRLSDSTE